MQNDLVVEKLDRLIAIMALAFQKEIATARDTARSDRTVALLLDETEDWVAAGVLKKRVSVAAQVAEKTVERRLSELVAISAVSARGNGRSREYKGTGVI